MATFEAQISGLVAQEQKDRIARMLEEDQEEMPVTYEADVIREALALGLAELDRKRPRDRVELYARRRRGLE